MSVDHRLEKMMSDLLTKTELQTAHGSCEQTVANLLLLSPFWH